MLLWREIKIAATRLIPLHKNKGKNIASSLQVRIEYAQNPNKTKQGELVSSYQCSPQTVDEEFLLTKKLYEQTTGRSQKNDIIAYQVRQSFKPGEVTAEEANKIGYEFASRFLKGKYAFIVATHMDRAHIHNHIIFNSTALDGTHKFKNFWLSYLAVQRLSDMVCLEHQLSVIAYKPYRDRQKRTTYPTRESNRDRLCGVIDEILQQKPTSYEDFLEKLKQQGYLVPQECGAKTAVRWAKVVDRKGRGLLFAADAEKPMFFSALPYTPHEMENAKHPYELPPVHYTVIRAMGEQMGVGGDDSWAANVHPEYIPDVSKPVEFTFTFRGI